MKFLNKKLSISVLISIWLSLPNIYLFFFEENLFVQQAIFMFLIVIYFINFGLKIKKIDKESIYVIVLLIFCMLFSLIFNIDNIVIVAFIFNFILMVYFISSHVKYDSYAFFDGFKFYSIANVFLLYSIYFLFGLQESSRSIIEGVHPNLFGLVCLTIALCSILMNRIKYTFLFMILSLYISYIVSSRATMMCIMVAFLMYLYVNLKNRILLKINIFFISSLLGIIYFDSIYAYFRQVFMLDDEYRGVGTGMSGRTERWEIAFDIIGENPIFGVGFKMAEPTLGFTIDNGYLAVLLEMGMFGMVAFIIILSLPIYFSIKTVFFGKNHNKESIFVAISIIVVLIYMYFEQRYINFGNPLTIIFFFAIFYSYSSLFNRNKK